MSCTYPNRERILEAYCRDTLDEAERVAFETHCFSCPVCRQELEIWDHTIRLIESEGDTLFSPAVYRSESRSSRKRRQHPRWMYVGGLAGVTAMILLSLLVIWRPRQPEPVPTAVPFLEELTGQVQRSASLDIIQPEIGAVLNNPIRFEWNTSLKDSLEIVIIDRQGHVMTRESVETGQSHVDLILSSGSGPYYWKLQSSTGLYYVGQFILSDQ
jgi:hypothetical protein